MNKEGSVKEFFVLEGFLSTQENGSLIDAHQLQKVRMRCTSNTELSALRATATRSPR